MIEKSIGKRIQQYRKAKNLTQETLSEMVGLSKNHLSTIERGISGVRLDVLVDIINILGVSADDIFCDVIDNGYKARATRLSDMIEKLTPEQQDKIFAVVEVMIKNS